MTIKFPLSLMFASVLATPAMAQTEPDWWLVYAKDRSGPAQFVDLSTIKGTQVSLLTVDKAGKEQRSATNVDCTGTPEPRTLPAFVCGSEAYRRQNGLNIRDFPPAQLARIYFQSSAG